MMRKSILRSQLMIAQAAVAFNNIGSVNHENLKPWQVETLMNSDRLLPSCGSNRINFNLEGREKFRKALREDLMNERKR